MAIRDPHIDEIKSKINSTNQRLKSSKAGNSLENSVILKTSSNSLVFDDPNTSRQTAIRKKLIENVRNLSFEEKLEFYIENPLIAERRLKTGHLPWDGPTLPDLPSTPENNQYYSDKGINIQNKVRASRKSTARMTMQLDFLKNPTLLGSKGGKLLLQIINDEKNSVKTSNAEIQELNRIIKRRLKILQQREDGWENDIFKYAVNKVLLKPTCKATNLIDSYFNQQEKPENL